MNDRLLSYVLLVAILLTSLLLAGCPTVPQREPVGVGVAPPLPAVQVPVFRPCPDPATLDPRDRELLEPDPPSSVQSRTAGLAELAAGVAADALKYRELARRRGDLLKACAKKTENPQ